MTVAIPLKAQTNYNELRFALRSLCKYHPDCELLIIGPKLPDWIKGVSHIKFPDAQFHEWKSKNIYDKVVKAFDHADELIFMNDDHMLLAPVNYYHHKGKLVDHISKRNPIGTYTILLQNTYDVFGDVNDFDTHCPIIYKKTEFEKISSLDWSKPHGYGIKTSYCALNGITGEFYPDLKFNDAIGDITGRLYFTTEDTCRLNGLSQLFPDKSKFEI